MLIRRGTFTAIVVTGCVSCPPQPIAQGMGLNIQTDRLWKDQAAIVLNSAVLYSFQVRPPSVGCWVVGRKRRGIHEGEEKGK